MNWNNVLIALQDLIKAFMPQTQPPTVSEQPPVDITHTDIMYPDWSTPHHAFHNTRVLCDFSGLTLAEKNIICACIYQESGFDINAVNYNKNAQGKILSTDYSLCQINDYYHIGQGKDFPSVQFVLDNPQKAVDWMIKMYKNGLLKMWVSYSSKAYLHWLKDGSPMWKL